MTAAPAADAIFDFWGKILRPVRRRSKEGAGHSDLQSENKREVDKYYDKNNNKIIQNPAGIATFQACPFSAHFQCDSGRSNALYPCD